MLLLRLGLPVTAFFVAFNPIWGFSWYFNTESWATGIYQKLTELRVDPWRANMIDAVARAYGGGDELFRIDPQGTAGNGDFSFLVIGDPGEGDASQYSLASRYLQLGQSDDVKFLVISSDVIYPAGAIEDYEAKFYLPLQGFAKPVYAIPGNHDWFDALESFNANFLEPRAARSAIEARVEADLGLTGTNTHRVDNLLAHAARLRQLYAVNVGIQRAAFFELQTDDFALLAIDTGILRTVDERQLAWIERALDRSLGKRRWPSSAIRVSQAATTVRRMPKAGMSPNLRKSLLRSIDCWRAETSRSPWPEIRTTLSITGKHRWRLPRAGDAPFRQWRRRSLPQHRYGPRLSNGASNSGLGVLPADRPPQRQDGCRDATMETAVLVLDKVVQCLAVRC